VSEPGTTSHNSLNNGVIKHIDSHRQRHPGERRGTESVLAVQQMAMGEAGSRYARPIAAVLAIIKCVAPFARRPRRLTTGWQGSSLCGGGPKRPR
jgi:hypothetical protein